MDKFVRPFLLWSGILLVIIMVYGAFGPNKESSVQELAYSDFLHNVDNGKVRSVTIKGQSLHGVLSDGQSFRTVLPYHVTLSDRLSESNVIVRAKAENEEDKGFFGTFIYWIPMLVLLGLWLFFMQNMQMGGGGRVMNFGKSRARLLADKREKVTFKDVAGVEEAKEELREIVEFLRSPSKFQRLGAKIPRGALLVGPPGTGKTLLARSVAGEANVPFFTISGSDFVEMFVGVGASRVRDMFYQGKKNAPCIIFIDEIDAVGRHRGAGLGGGNDEREQTLNQLLVEMDGFDVNEGIILIAATNRPDVLDPALLRPGRFDRQIVVTNPDIEGRAQILEVHTRKTKLAPDVKLKVLARATPGFSGADLSNLVNEAALLAARRNRVMVTMADFESAKDKVMMGAERRSMVMTEKERELTAYHEAGHALVGIHVAGNDPLHKVTIIPRGRALGVTMNVPEKDRYSMRKTEVEGRIAMIFGGRVAEEITFGKDNVTSGAANDIIQATRMARAMVTEWGMSDKLGPLRYSENEDEIFLGHSVTQRKNVSDATARLIDEEIHRIIREGEEKARKTLVSHKKQLTLLAKTLLEYETLSGDDVMTLLQKGSLPKLRSTDDDSGSQPTPSMPVTHPPATPSPDSQSVKPARGSRGGSAKTKPVTS
ncbi:MAG: ATP-dependent metallopeptidase FtsH/Yme1/Tma family protein [Alphaproteobacteria bacterium GM202ARS2]|nr:ATP-dependent metallopeptidase FtsH/Yme1/Tma family protein [Alphaproteobacteria bacterium GM202ARS2]